MADTQKSQKITVETPTVPAQSRNRALTYFEEAERDLEQMFDSFMGRVRPLGRDWFARRGLLERRAPSIDIIDQDDNLLLRAELPGVEKNDLDISVNHDTVSIKASTRSEKKEEETDYYRHEISSSYAARTVALPCSVDGKRAVAQLKDGVLELNLPKVEKSTRQRIEVK